MRDRAYKLRTRYSLTESVYNDILQGQGQACKICGEYHTEEKKLHVDHDVNSETGKIYVRGLLCGRCNSAIAFARHTPAILRNAAKYLELK